MTNLFFTIDGIRYVIIYNNKNSQIYKQKQNEIVHLSKEEDNKIKKILNEKYNYIYNSEILNNLVNENEKLENKNYIINFLNWLEQIIPENCRTNFYNNVKSLQADLNLNFQMPENDIVLSQEYSTTGGYNTVENKLTMEEQSLKELWQISKKANQSEEFYWIHYAQTLLHELSHMSSSKYNPETKISLCGFDRFPPKEEEDKNRGLTEGFTEIISMSGVPGTIEVASNYYIEACLINQLIQIIGNDAFLNAYFSNLGIKPIKEKLQNVINDEQKSFELFRNIEFNFQIKNFDGKQNILGSIQMSILDYLEQKIKTLLECNNIKEINDCLTIYEQMLITPEKLIILQKNPKNYDGLDENLERFNYIKQRYSHNLNDIIQSK